MRIRVAGVAVLSLAVGCGGGAAAHKASGDIAMLGGFAFSPVGPEAVAYVSLQNTGKQEDTLLSIETPFAGQVTLHDSRQEGGMVHMVGLERLILPPGMVAEMAPGGLHLMLTNLKVALPAGRTLPLRLHFARAGDLEVEIPINRYGDTH